jgi:4-amino-4-deoxy-L-arabinose transferase-like glycosyltransferase
MNFSARSGLWLLVALLTSVRFAVAGLVGLGDAEAYYWRWSQALDWSYFDHGPLVALLIRAGSALFGDTPFGIRAPFILLSAATLLLLADLTRRFARKLGHEKPDLAALWAAATLSVMPMFIVAGGAANPDVPFIFLITLVLHQSLLCDQGQRLWPLWVAALTAGLAFSTKLTAALLLPLFLLLALQHARPLLALSTIAITGLLTALPVLYWNASHDFASLGYHFVGRHTQPVGPSLLNLGKLVGGQLGYVAPVPLFFLLSVALPRAFEKRTQHPYGVVLAAAAGLLGGAYVLVLLVPSAEPHWPAAGYLPLIPLLALWLTDNAGRVRRWLWGGAIYSLLVFAAFHVHVLTDLGVRLMPDSYEPRYDLANELVGWPAVANAVDSRLRASSRRAVAGGCHYTVCSQLAFASRGRFTVVCPSPRVSQFDFFTLPRALAAQAGDGQTGDGQRLRGIDLLYVKDERFAFDADVLYRCRRVERVAAVKIRRGGRIVRRFELQRCHDFSGLRAPRWPPRRDLR